MSITQSYAAEEAKEEKSGGLLGLNVDKTSYISLNPIIVPILGDNGEAQLVTIMISLNSPTESFLESQSVKNNKTANIRNLFCIYIKSMMNY